MTVIEFAHCVHIVWVGFKRELAVLDDVALLIAVGFIDPEITGLMAMSLVTAVAPVRWTSTTTGFVSGDMLSFSFLFSKFHHVNVVVKFGHHEKSFPRMWCCIMSF